MTRVQIHESSITFQGTHVSSRSVFALLRHCRCTKLWEQVVKTRTCTHQSRVDNYAPQHLTYRCDHTSRGVKSTVLVIDEGMRERTLNEKVIRTFRTGGFSSRNAPPSCSKCACAYSQKTYILRVQDNAILPKYDPSTAVHYSSLDAFRSFSMVAGRTCP